MSTLCPSVKELSDSVDEIGGWLTACIAVLYSCTCMLYSRFSSMKRPLVVMITLYRAAVSFTVNKQQKKWKLNCRRTVSVSSISHSCKCDSNLMYSIEYVNSVCPSVKE